MVYHEFLPKLRQVVPSRAHLEVPREYLQGVFPGMVSEILPIINPVDKGLLLRNHSDDHAETSQKAPPSILKIPLKILVVGSLEIL